MRIETDSIETKVYFEVEHSHGRVSTLYISIPNNHLIFDDELPAVNIPATGDMTIESINGFIEAVRLAGLIASGEFQLETS